MRIEIVGRALLSDVCEIVQQLHASSPQCYIKGIADGMVLLGKAFLARHYEASPISHLNLAETILTTFHQLELNPILKAELAKCRETLERVKEELDVKEYRNGSGKAH